MMPHFAKCCFNPQAGMVVGIFSHVKGCVNQLKEAVEMGLKSFPLLHTPMTLSHP